MKTFATIALSLALTALIYVPVSASILGLASPGVTVIADENRESIFDVDGSGTLSPGDVLIGYARLDTVVSAPPSNLGPNQELVLFATQVGTVTKLDGTPRAMGDNALINFVPVSGAGAALGLDLGSLTGGLVTQAGALAANFSNVGTDKTIISTGVGVNIVGLAGEIAAEGTLSSVAGLGKADDFWQSFFTSGVAAASPVDALAGLAGVNLGAAFANPLFGANGFFAGLSILSADSGQFEEIIPLLGSPTPGSTHQLGIINGEISGAANADFGGGFNPFFGSIPALDDVDPPINFYGAASNADVTFQAVPEPTSVLVWGAIASIVGSIARRKSARS